MENTKDTMALAAHLCRTVVMPILGMAFFWVFMRYQNFFMILYPRDEAFSVGALTLPVHSAFLVALLVFAAIGLKFWHAIEHVI